MPGLEREQLMTEPVAGGAEQFEAKLGSFVRENRLYGAAAGVVHGDELVWSGGAGFADIATGRLAGPDVLYRIASITKTFTGTAILQLRDAGKLDLDDPVVKWVPELGDSASPETIGGVTIRRLLSHESGLVSEPPGTDFLAMPPSYEGVVARNLERAGEIFTAVPPNTQLKYCNLGYQLLGEIVSRVGEIPYPEYVVERILSCLLHRRCLRCGRKAGCGRALPISGGGCRSSLPRIPVHRVATLCQLTRRCSPRRRVVRCTNRAT
jgi:CubicO group peptidase (beta-lactamase class C family)